jgi:hypothetical protein
MIFRRAPIVKIVILQALLIALSVALACSPPMTRSRLVGIYDAEHENGNETLELRADGTYLHRFRAKNGIESTSSDKWEFAPSRGRDSLVLHNFFPRFPGDPTVKKDWTLRTKEDYGLLRLYLSYEPRQFYLESRNSSK